MRTKLSASCRALVALVQVRRSCATSRRYSVDGHHAAGFASRYRRAGAAPRPVPARRDGRSRSIPGCCTRSRSRWRHGPRGTSAWLVVGMRLVSGSVGWYAADFTLIGDLTQAVGVASGVRDLGFRGVRPTRQQRPVSRSWQANFQNSLRTVARQGLEHLACSAAESDEADRAAGERAAHPGGGCQMPPATAPGPLLPATLAQARQQMEEPQGNRPRRPRRPRLNLAKNRPQAGNPLHLLNLMRLNTKLNAIGRRGGRGTRRGRGSWR